jgi:serine/threonine protein kinase/tetratricopeptide (TPR) repeat protein
MVGQALGHYRILRKLGSGGMGEVYAAEDTRLRREVALKMLPPEMVSDPQRRERFQREAEAVARLDHPNIVTIHSIETATISGEASAPVHFFTMQLVRGTTLQGMIPAEGLGVDRLLDLGVPLADAVGAAHREGVVHRDLKPGNVMVGDDGRLRVLDFGLAKLRLGGAGSDDPDETRTSEATALTRAGTVLGTAPYMSPEQVKGLSVDPRSDVFSLGCVLYEMATGCRPFTAATSAELMSAILRDSPESVRTRKPEIPVRVGEIIERCLAKNPTERYATAGELHGDLVTLRREGVMDAAEHLEQRQPTVTSASPRTSSLSLPARPSLAVMPFVNLSGDAAGDDFAMGLWADINGDLVKISGLFLVSQGATGQYGGKRFTPQQVGRELGVRHVLEGTVRQDGSRVRITAQLTDAESGAMVWAERFDRTLEGLFELQDEINEAIVHALDIKLLSGESYRIAGRSIKNPKARELFYRALAALFTYKHAEILESRRLLTEVTMIEPDAPLPHAFLAFAHYFEVSHGFSDSPEKSLDEALAAADRSLELDDPTGEAHMVRGMVLLMRGDHDAALEASERAVPDRPSCPWGYALKGALLNYAGKPAEAVEMLQRAIRLTPAFPPIFVSVLAMGLYLQGRHDEAVDAARGTLELTPGNLEALVVLAAAQSASGRAAEARATRQEILRIKTDFAVDDFVRSQPFRDPTLLTGLAADLREAGLP